MRHLRRRLAAQGGLVGAALLVMLLVGAFAVPSASAHGRSNGPALHIVVVQAHDKGMNGPFWFTMPTKIPTGWVEFVFENKGTQPHQAQFFLLKGKATESQLVHALEVDPTTKAALALASAAGGANVTVPGGRQDVIQWVKPGHYVVLCFVMGHFARGMHMSFWASGNVKGNRDTDDSLVHGQPRTNGVATLASFHIGVPSAMRDDDFVFIKVENLSREDTHEMALMRVPKGTSTKEAINALTAQTPPAGFRPIGGMGALPPGGTGWMEIRLAPGTYAAYCAVPDEETGMPHFLMGMITVFTVH